jgi:hypothetical protein
MSESTSHFFSLSLFLSSSSRPLALRVLAGDGRSSWSSSALVATYCGRAPSHASCLLLSTRWSAVGRAHGAHVRRSQPQWIYISRVLPLLSARWSALARAIGGLSPRTCSATSRSTRGRSREPRKVVTDLLHHRHYTRGRSRDSEIPPRVEVRLPPLSIHTSVPIHHRGRRPTSAAASPSSPSSTQASGGVRAIRRRH